MLAFTGNGSSAHSLFSVGQCWEVPRGACELLLDESYPDASLGSGKNSRCASFSFLWLSPNLYFHPTSPTPRRPSAQADAQKQRLHHSCAAVRRTVTGCRQNDRRSPGLSRVTAPLDHGWPRLVQKGLFAFFLFLQPSWDCQAIYEESRGKNAVGEGEGGGAV